jgi:hypothetical protein
MSSSRDQSAMTLEEATRTQVRVKGRIICVDEGNMRVATPWGELPFEHAAIKKNSRFPDRLPQAGDNCDFRVSQRNPPKATSIRLALRGSEINTVIGSSSLQATPNSFNSLGFDMEEISGAATGTASLFCVNPVTNQVDVSTPVGGNSVSGGLAAAFDALHVKDDAVDLRQGAREKAPCPTSGGTREEDEEGEMI